MTEAMDRRSARTRRLLHDALIALVLRKDYDAITVQDVIDEADVGRSTFYAHFSGKEELFRSRFRQLRAELQSLQDAAAARQFEPGVRPPFAFSAALFEHACAHSHIYKALIGGRGSNVVVEELGRILTELVRTELAQSARERDVPIELATQLVVTTIHTVLKWSLERKPALSSEAMEITFRKFVVHGIGELMGQHTAAG